MGTLCRHMSLLLGMLCGFGLGFMAGCAYRESIQNHQDNGIPAQQSDSRAQRGGGEQQAIAGDGIEERESERRDKRQGEPKDTWGAAIGGIQCGVRVSSARNTFCKLPMVEYVVRNVSKAVVGFQGPNSWRFELKDPDGTVRVREPDGLLGSKEEVYLRKGESARGVIRDLGSLFQIDASGTYRLCVICRAGSRVQASSGWATFDVNGSGSQTPQGGSTIPASWKRRVDEVVPPRTKSGVDTFITLLPPDNQQIWGGEGDGIRVAIVTASAYRLGSGIPINIWVENVTTERITWHYLREGNWLRLSVYDLQGQLVPKTESGSSLFSDENGEGNVGSVFKSDISGGGYSGLEAIDLERVFEFPGPGKYTVRCSVELRDFKRVGESVRKASREVKIEVITGDR